MFPVSSARVLLAVALIFYAADLRGQEEEKTPDEFRMARASEIPGIEARAAALLQLVKPLEEKGVAREPWKEIRLKDGSMVRWGRFVRRDEVAALVSVKELGEDEGFDSKRHDVSYFVWHKGHWELRQFLGNADSLEIHYRNDHPSVFLQGSFHTGPHDGEFVSWSYDEKKGQWTSTGFEDWGPFYLKGDYLVTGRGFERLAHDDTHWIYAYKNGKKGELLVRHHINDSGDFDVTFRDAASMRWIAWSFRQDHEKESRTTVTISPTKDPEDGEFIPENDSPTRPQAEIQHGDLNPELFFALLTGLDPALLEQGWCDKLPPRPPLRIAPIEVRGDGQIVKRLRGPEMRAYEEEEKRIPLAVVSEIVPSGKEKEPTELVSGSAYGQWGPLFGGPDIVALIATGMKKEGGAGADAPLYLLRWEGAWKYVQSVGLVSSTLDYNGKPTWGIRRDVADHKPAIYYVLSETDLNFSTCDSWRYDSTSRRLVPTDWTQQGIPSIADGSITFTTRDFDVMGNPSVKDVFRFEGGQPGTRIGQIRPGYEKGHMLRYTFRIPDESTGKDVIWRLWKTKAGYQPHADTYVMCRDEGEEAGDFRPDVTLEFDWGDENFRGDEAAAEYVWRRLSNTGARAFFGSWVNEEMPQESSPLKVKVAGNPEAIKQFAWPSEKGTAPKEE